ncbi:MULTISPECIES: RtcB family protein [unclassified Bacillus cereus group]|uniref:RtcB family protein n=1 Tax=unclassified Bacillus cereus group TaxID=2750818 RepID=UPI0029C3D339|nr:RtcB family protein [Bacillus cereus group sp. BfR-BA-02730]MDX5808822.1 RtcB family protein [Bacillus cereus group sp. BfR-BA-02730]
MIELQGKFTSAKVFTENVEQETIAQVIELCNQDFVRDSKIRIMPDTHYGKGCTIGTTMTIQDAVAPSLVGTDIGCGMYTVKLKEKEMNFELLDNVIRKYVPYGASIRGNNHEFAKLINLKELRCADSVKIQRAQLNIGSLGSGNHFIECNQDDEGNMYIVIHSGSRYLGGQVAKFYQEKAYDALTYMNQAKEEAGRVLFAEGNLVTKKTIHSKIKKELAYLEGSALNDYLHDMRIAQQFAEINRKAMMNVIIRHMDLTVVEEFTTIHNYIDLENMILRKGAISAQKDEKVIIPINMRDGSLICYGKGNPDWNFSGPHGAGRLMSRSMAKEQLSLDEYEDTMKHVWSSSVGQSTLDESPMAYKPMDEIMTNIQDSVHIEKIIKPVYNFKAN